MDAETFVQRLKQQRFFRGQIAHVELMPQRPAQYGEVDGGHEWRYVDRQLPTTLRFLSDHLAPAE